MRRGVNQAVVLAALTTFAVAACGDDGNDEAASTETTMAQATTMAPATTSICRCSSGTCLRC